MKAVETAAFMMQEFQMKLQPTQKVKVKVKKGKVNKSKSESGWDGSVYDATISNENCKKYLIISWKVLNWIVSSLRCPFPDHCKCKCS